MFYNSGPPHTPWHNWWIYLRIIHAVAFGHEYLWLQVVVHLGSHDSLLGVLFPGISRKSHKKVSRFQVHLKSPYLTTTPLCHSKSLFSSNMVNTRHTHEVFKDVKNMFFWFYFCLFVCFFQASSAPILACNRLKRQKFCLHVDKCISVFLPRAELSVNE